MDFKKRKKKKKITAHSWCSGHSISISTCEAWRAIVRVQVSWRELHLHIHLDYDKVEISTCWRVCWVKVEVQVFRRELYTHIHLDYDRIEILSCINIYIYIYILFIQSLLLLIIKNNAQCLWTLKKKKRITAHP